MEVIEMFRQPLNWREVNRLRRDMDRMFENAVPRLQRYRDAGFPAINVWTSNEEGIVVTAELPGVHPDDIEITVTVDKLTISGKRQPKEASEAVKYHRRERPFGEFSRTFQLPYSVNKDKVKANMQMGILQISLPRAEAEKPRQITVRVGQ
jgi:HSP20 family protein